LILFVQQLLNGIVLGALFTLVALAFSLNMGVLGVLNIAIAELFMLGGFIAVSIFELGLPLPVVLVGAMAMAALLSIVLERLGYRYLSRGTERPDPLITLLSTVGFGLVLRNFATNKWGANPTFFPDNLFTERFAIGPFKISAIQIVGIVVSVLLVAALWYLVSRTRTGRWVRAVAEDREIAMVLGIKVRRVELITFVVSGALAGGAGVLLGLTYGTITPEFGIEIGLAGIAAMILGGVGNIWGALVAGPILGIASVMSGSYIGGNWEPVVVFGLLIATLLIRPQGLLGSQELVSRRV
jgi:branched-chain amino acid transport system permease protein